jgi:phage-related tail fiber protein
MTNLTEKEQWEDGIYQIEKADPVVGGPDGLSNRQGQQLANRTRYLKGLVDALLNGTKNAAVAVKLATARAIGLSGDASGSANFDGSANASITVTLAKTGVAAGTYGGVTVDEKGRVTAGSVVTAVANGGTGNSSGQAPSATKLATARTINGVPFDGTANIAITDDSKAPLNSPILTGDPRAPTPAAGDNDTSIATTAFVQTAIAALVNGSPQALNQLNELAAALGNNPNYATDMATALGLKANSESPTLTGTPKAPRPAVGTNTDQIQTAAGVLAQLAAFGLGTKNLATLADLDDKTIPPGIYMFGSGTKGTAPDTYGVVLVASQAAGTSNSNWANQVFFGTRGKVFFRNSVNLADWSTWTTLSMAESLAKVATGGRFADLATEVGHWMAGKSAANGWKSVYLQNQEPTGNVVLEMASSGGYIVASYQAVQDGAGGWGVRFYYTPPGDTAKDRRVGWLGISTAGEVQLGGASLPAGRTGQILTSEGDQGINGLKRFNGEVQSTNANAWRQCGSDYGTFWRNDGTALYLLLTNKGDAYGAWNSLRPFAVSLSTGRVAMSAGLETLTVASGDRSNNAASTRWVGNEVGERAGTIDFFAMTAAPLGYLKANGAAVSRTTYATLFAAIGTTFGAGDGSTTFNLPDVRGEFIRAWDDSRGVDGGRVLGSNQASQNLLHSHSATASTAGAHSHTTSVKADRANGEGNAVFGDENWYSDNVVLPSSVAGDHTHAISIGSSGGNESRPRNVALLACIKY